MAKAPTEVEHRFRIGAEVSCGEIGFVLAELALLGIENIRYELITDVPTYKQNGARKAHDVSAEREIEIYTEQHPTFEVKDLTAHFKTLGRTSGAAYTACRVMVNREFLRRLGPGMYQRTDVVALAAPKAPAAPEQKARAKRGPPKQYETSNVDFLVACISRKKKFEVADLVRQFTDAGRNPKSATSVLSALTSKGFFKKLGEGEYQVLKMPPPTPPRTKKRILTPHLNGSTQAGVASHG